MAEIIGIQHSGRSLSGLSHLRQKIEDGTLKNKEMARIKVLLASESRLYDSFLKYRWYSKAATFSSLSTRKNLCKLIV